MERCLCKEMIISAANVLPLTAKTYGDRKLGTRHRTIGLSEISDALVLVVSEETGKTSFCMEGTLYPYPSAPNILCLIIEPPR